MAGLMQEHFEVADDGVGSLPALAHTTRLGDLDPALTGCTNTVVDVNAKWQLGCVFERERERVNQKADPILL